MNLKRAFDITLSCMALFIFSLPMVIISSLLILKEKHPIIFKQQRIGRSKKTFQIYKFQTMLDEVVTDTGKILRRTGLDELPQFINVLQGDMSIVGPRAITLYDINRLHWNDDYHKIRWHVNPGITGFAQLYGGQHKKTSWFWDSYYIKHYSLPIDFMIISLSFLMNVFGKTRIRRLIFSKNSLK